MTFTSKKLKDSQVQLSISLDKEDLLSYAREAENILAKGLRVEGFRPGKAPKELVRKRVGEQVIKEEALNLAVRKSVSQVLSEQNIEVLEQSDFKIKENSPARLVFEIKLLVFPEVKLGEYKSLAVKKGQITIADNEVEDVLKNIARSRTTTKDVDRPVQSGDRVEIDFEVKDKGVIIEGGKSTNHPVVVGENKFVPGFEDELVGLRVGEKKTFALNVPADYYQKSIAGKEIDFLVVVKKVQEIAIPEINDELARNLGRFDSKADLEENIKDGLRLEKEAKEKEKLRLAILKEIGSKTTVEVPELLIEKQLDDMVRGFDNELHQKGMELGLYLAHIKKTQEDLRRDWRGRAKEQIKLDLIIRTIAKEEHIRVSDEEVGQELQAVLQQYMAAGGQDGGSGSGSEVLQNIDPEQLKNRILGVLLNEKVFEFLEKHNQPV